MLPERTVNIIRDFCRFIGAETCSEWCVGVTTHSEHHLFHELKIAPDPRRYIYRLAADALEAQAIARAFWNIECQKPALDLDSGEAGLVGVFAYRIAPVMTNATIPSAIRQQGAQINANP